MNPKELRLAQMDAVLQDAASHSLPQRPPAGWLRAIREALGMTSAVLAHRLEITASGLRKLEQAEATDAPCGGWPRRSTASCSTRWCPGARCGR
jgi:DNA-binding transcriptional regulator YiaG